MSFSKTFRAFTLIGEKIYLKTSRCFPKILIPSFKHKGPDKNYFIFKLTSFTVLTTATAVGFSIYFANQHKISCELADTTSITDITCNDSKKDYSAAINKSRDILQRLKDEIGAPGMVIGVSVDGEVVWEEGIGYSDIENRVPCTRDTVMRIASISKSITMTAVAKLWEQGKLDLDKPVQEYVPSFPSKTFDGKSAIITCRHLVSHLGGIRNYDKNFNNRNHESKITNDKTNTEKNEVRQKSEFQHVEYYIKENYKDVKSALAIFKDDPLAFKPGTKFHYTTHGWTLVSAIVEAASKEPFTTHITKLFKNLGMIHTYLDLNDVLIYNRSRNYIKSRTGRIINAPFVDNSHKWAGGGFLSTVGDLLQFANAMLYSLQFNLTNLYTISQREQVPNEVTKQKLDKTNSNNRAKSTEKCKNQQKALPGYLGSKTLEVMWSPVTDAKIGKYGMGWEIYPEKHECQYCEKRELCVFHSGGAIGASSILFILPKKIDSNKTNCEHIPKGIVIAILTNLQAVSFRETALKIAQIFDKESITC